MTSPFPGMDPYIEDPAFWQDFHRSFVTYCRDALLDKLPDPYEARIDEQVRLINRPAGKDDLILPDVSVTHDRHSRGGTAVVARPANVSSIEPIPNEMPFDAEQVRDAWIQIRLKRDRSLVTAIELLSPSNKAGVGYWDYRDKRINLLYRNANLVEIDLLLGGRRLDLRNPLPTGDYFAYVTREENGPHVDVYAWSLRDPLPTIPIPLKSPDPDIGLNIAEIFAITYERGRYARSLGYAADPTAPLAGDALAWAKERAASIRR
jgi:hypothetical protein